MAVVHLVPAAGQKQLTGAVEGGRVQRFAVDQADQVLPVVLPSQAQAHQGEYREPGSSCGWTTSALTDSPGGNHCQTGRVQSSHHTVLNQL